MSSKFLKLTNKGKQIAEDDERLLKIIDAFDEDGIFQYYDNRDLKDSFDLTPKEMFDLKREGLVEEIKPEDEPVSLEDYAYELEIEWRLKESIEEMKGYQINHQIPPIEVFRRHQKVFKEYMRLSGQRGLFF